MHSTYDGRGDRQAEDESGQEPRLVFAVLLTDIGAYNATFVNRIESNLGGSCHEHQYR
jgi:hypothetical protein